MSTVFESLPGVRIKEVRLGAPPIAGVGTSTAGFVGKAPVKDRFTNQLRLVTSADQFLHDYVKDTTDPEKDDTSAEATALGYAVLGFFQNGGTVCYVVNVGDAPDDGKVKAGLALLEKKEDINIIAAPGFTSQNVYDALRDQAQNTRNRFAILDPPPAVDAISKLLTSPKIPPDPNEKNVRPQDSIWAAFYYPRIFVSPMLRKDEEDLKKDPTKATTFVAPPSGHIAGLYARVDAQRGVHKAPANERLLGALGVEHLITDNDQNQLNAQGVNIIRVFAEGPVVWGARTLLNKDAEITFRYISTRRLTTFIEQSLRIGLRFAVFEPNNLGLRQTITRSVRGFLDGVWRDGALFGATADEAYYVRFPELFNRDEDRAKGELTLEVGIRVTFPAEFIIIRIGLLDRPANAA